jgi:AcrR family transcriptional regulator
MTPSYHHGDLKTVLLAYARAQMENVSIDGLSMREIAKAVGVSHTAAYRHFTDKRALLDAVAVQGFEELRQACQAAADDVAAEDAADDARARLKACGLAYVRFALASPRLLAHMFIAVSDAQASAALMSAGAQLFEVLCMRVAEGQERGVFRSADTRQLSHACWALVHGLSTLLGAGLLKGDANPHGEAMDSAGQAIDTFLDGLVDHSARK